MKEYYQPEKGGVVRFKGGPEARGVASLSNRVAALKLAQKFCHGPVKVVGEGTEMSEDSSSGAGERVKGDQDTGAVFVQFRCAVQGLRVDVR